MSAWRTGLRPPGYGTPPTPLRRRTTPLTEHGFVSIVCSSKPGPKYADLSAIQRWQSLADKKAPPRWTPPGANPRPARTPSDPPSPRLNRRGGLKVPALNSPRSLPQGRLRHRSGTMSGQSEHSDPGLLCLGAIGLVGRVAHPSGPPSRHIQITSRPIYSMKSKILPNVQPERRNAPCSGLLPGLGIVGERQRWA